MIPVIKGKDSLSDFIQKNSVINTDTSSEIESRVREIISEVRCGGDDALKKIIQRLNDPVLPDGRFQLTTTEIQSACARVSDENKAAFAYAGSNITAFAEATIQSIKPVQLQHDGFSVGLDWKPIERVACYVPAGRYPLPSTALMTAITAKVAGVEDIAIVSPRLTDEVIYAGHIAGANSFHQLGGAHAVAAMAYGTETIEPVSMLVGPGNAYVTEAKRQLQGIIGIDMLAGPSEVVIIADSKANPEWIAWDLLAQAEHSPDACAYLLTDSESLISEVGKELGKALLTDGLPEYLSASNSWGCMVLLPNVQACIAVCNELAPEHIELQVSEPEVIKAQLKDYGAVFMGYHTPVPFGDYAAGPNHTLPTNRSARFSGTLTPLTFLRPQSWIWADTSTNDLAKASYNMAVAEGLIAHASSSQLRVKASAKV